MKTSSNHLPLTTLLLLLFFASPLFVALEDSSVWDANEAFYAQTPREMIDRSSWLVPYFNGEPRLNKPPLSYWVVAAFYRLFGVSLFWERLTMASFAYGSVLFVFWIGRFLWDSTVALWAAGILATTFRFLVLSRRLLIDVLLLFLLLAAICFFLRWTRGARPLDFVLSALFLALGCLAKGPVTLFPVILLFGYLLFQGRIRTLFSAPLLPAGSVFLLISASWYVLVGVLMGWHTVTDFLLKENLGRFSHLDYGSERGPLYYLGVFLGDFFPWSLLFLGGLFWWFREGRLQVKKSDLRTVRWLLLWILVWIVFFSVSRNKQEYYILPVYPAAAIFVAACLRSRRFPGWLTAGTGVSLLGAGLLVFLVGRSLFPDVPWLWIPALLLLPVPWLFRRGRWTGAILCLCFAYTATFTLYLRPLERYRPVQAFAELIRQAEAGKKRDFVSGYYRLASPSLAFYLNQPILELHGLEDAVRHLDSPKAVYLVLEGSDFDPLQEATRVQLRIVDARPQLSTRVILSHLMSGELSARNWTLPVYLISNR